MSGGPSASTFRAVRGWLLLTLGVLLIVTGALRNQIAWIGWGFSLLGIEPLTRAHEEVRP